MQFHSTSIPLYIFPDCLVSMATYSARCSISTGSDTWQNSKHDNFLFRADDELSLKVWQPKILSAIRALKYILSQLAVFLSLSSSCMEWNVESMYTSCRSPSKRNLTFFEFCNKQQVCLSFTGGGFVEVGGFDTGDMLEEGPCHPQWKHDIDMNGMPIPRVWNYSHMFYIQFSRTGNSLC